jgi:rhodanese-related sulfurtransferase
MLDIKMVTLNPQETADLIASTDVDIVDVRDEREFAAGHVVGARNIPLETLRADPDKYLVHKPIIVVCQKGVRSLSAAKLLERLGYSDVYNLDGGTSAWAKEGLQLATESIRTAA